MVCDSRGGGEEYSTHDKFRLGHFKFEVWLWCSTQGVGGTIILVGLVLRREIQAGEKDGLGDIDMVKHTQAEQAE